MCFEENFPSMNAYTPQIETSDLGSHSITAFSCLLSCLEVTGCGPGKQVSVAKTLSAKPFCRQRQAPFLQAVSCAREHRS